MDAISVAQKRRRTDEQAIDDAEHRRIGADAESEREHDAEGEARLGAKAADRVAEILQGRLDEDRAARVATLLLGAVHPAECQAGTPKCFRARNSHPLVLLGLVLDVKAKLVGKLRSMASRRNSARSRYRRSLQRPFSMIVVSPLASTGTRYQSPCRRSRGDARDIDIGARPLPDPPGERQGDDAVDDRVCPDP